MCLEFVRLYRSGSVQGCGSQNQAVEGQVLSNLQGPNFPGFTAPFFQAQIGIILNRILVLTEVLLFRLHFMVIMKGSYVGVSKAQ